MLPFPRPSPYSLRPLLIAACALVLGLFSRQSLEASPLIAPTAPVTTTWVPQEPTGDAEESPAPELQAEAGPQVADELPVIMGIEVENLTAYDPIKIAQRMGLRVGQRLPRSVDVGMKRLWTDFNLLIENNGYSFEEVEGGVIVHLVFIENEVALDPQFAGNVHFDVDQLREWALLDDRVEVSVDEAERIEDRIRRAYKRQGYHFVEVSHLLGGEGVRRREMIFEIREGPKVYVKDVTVEGNESIQDEGVLIWKKTLKKLAGVGTKGRGLFAWWGHRFDEEVINADRIALANVFRERGFIDVVVDAELAFTVDRSGVEVKYVIDEGPRYTVESLEIRAVEFEDVQIFPGQTDRQERSAELVIPADELKALLSLKVGEPLEQVRVQLDQRELLRRYGEEGHIPASSFEDRGGNSGWRFLAPDQVWDYVNKTVAVTYVLQQGRPFTLRFLEIAGNENTKDHVIRKSFAQLEGDRVDTVKMQSAMRRVRGSGFFDDPYGRGQHPPPQLSYRTVDGEPDLVDAFVTVKEGRTINANLSGGV
ncbi:MAG: outer membrane protein insertion porin family, partial [Planctomycetota bacterium]